MERRLKVQVGGRTIRLSLKSEDKIMQLIVFAMVVLRWLTYWPRRILAKRQGCLVVSGFVMNIDEIENDMRKRMNRFTMYDEGYIIVKDEHTPEQDWHENVDEAFRNL